MTEAVAYKAGCLRNAVLLMKSYMHTSSLSVLTIFVIIVSRKFVELVKICGYEFSFSNFLRKNY